MGNQTCIPTICVQIPGKDLPVDTGLSLEDFVDLVNLEDYEDIGKCIAAAIL